MSKDKPVLLSELFIRLIDLKTAKAEAQKRLMATHPFVGSGRDKLAAEIEKIDAQIAEVGRAIDERG